MNILNEILENTKLELELRKKVKPISQLKETPFFSRECLSLCKALQKDEITIIAEIKKASPSKGIIRDNFDPLQIAKQYVAGGASAISVLTDKKYFQGDIKYISAIRPIVTIPILRKDFIIDSYQLVEAKAYGADAVLLIASALTSIQLLELNNEAEVLGLECLVEIHNERELNLLDLSKIKIIGINNRNLTDFTVDISTTIRLAKQIPAEIKIVSESGIFNKTEIDLLAKYNIRSVLVGESLMREQDPGIALRRLLRK